MRIVIPSRRRVDVLESSALRLFPEATVCVGESEAEAYGKITKNLLVHPDDVTGIGPLRQWMMDHVDDPTIFMADDDITACYSLVGVRARRLTDPSDVRQVIENTATCAKEAGARVFGFNQAWDVRKFLPLKPVSFTGWVGGAIGVHGRELQFDTSLKLRCDIDFCLQSLLKDRIIYQDLRFAFSQRRFEGTGGNAVSRSSAAHEREVAFLQRRWGAHLKVRNTKGTTRLIVNVPRSQSTI